MRTRKGNGPALSESVKIELREHSCLTGNITHKTVIVSKGQKGRLYKSQAVGKEVGRKLPKVPGRKHGVGGLGTRAEKRRYWNGKE